jgi:hypothetical protein
MASSGEYASGRRPIRTNRRLGSRQAARTALATVRLPLMLNSSQPGRVFALADRRDRARVYEIALNEGQPPDTQLYVDGVLLVDLWSDLALLGPVRAAWAPLTDDALGAEVTRRACVWEGEHLRRRRTEMGNCPRRRAGPRGSASKPNPHRPVRLEFGRSGRSRA